MLPTDRITLEFRFRANDLAGIGSKANRWQVLQAFLMMSEGQAERLIEGKNGFIVLESIPNQPSSGAVYVYHEPSRSFYWLQFGARIDDLSASEFDRIANQLAHLTAAETTQQLQERNRRPRSRNLARFTRRSRSLSAGTQTAHQSSTLSLVAGTTAVQPTFSAPLQISVAQ